MTDAVRERISIATSREPLSLPAEHVVPVPPLELPPAGAGEPLAQLRQNEAVMLFTERARAAAGRFELTASNQVAVVELCRRLDGSILNKLGFNSRAQIAAWMATVKR